MSYAPRHKDFGSLVANQAPPTTAAVAKKTGILRRVFDAFMQSRQRDVDRKRGSETAASSA